MAKFADIHCHTALHPFAYHIAEKKRNNDVWDYDPPKNKQRTSQFPEFSQSDFTTLARGGVKLIYVSIYPIEQGWFDPAVLGTGFLADVAAKAISKVPARFVNMVQEEDHEYFKFFEAEYKYLMNGSDKPRDVKLDSGAIEEFRYIMLKPGDNIDQVLQDDHTIGVIVTAEGAQSLISGSEKKIENGSFKLDTLISNIEEVKGWKCPPFFISMSHHFYNGLCGHTRSLPAPASSLLKQAIGLNEPINAKGRKVIDCFLGLNEFSHHTHRILIDTKHMSVAARQEYYAKIKDFNEGKEDHEKIPIVVSHTAYGDNRSMAASIEWPDTEKNKYNASKQFNDWAINLADDEIVEIFNSNGIIGLNFDERVLSGNDILEDYKEIFSKRERKEEDKRENIQEFWANQMLDHILSIVKVIKDADPSLLNDSNKAKIWKMLALGTDFDGMINAEDGFITSEEFKEFNEAVTAIFSARTDKDEYLMGIPIDEALNNIMFDNAFNFAKMYYFKS